MGEVKLIGFALGNKDILGEPISTIAAQDRVVYVLFQVHLQTLCIGAMKYPTIVRRQQLGHMVSIASRHSCKLDLVGHSLIYLMQDHTSPD